MDSRQSPGIPTLKTKIFDTKLKNRFDRRAQSDRQTDLFALVFDIPLADVG
jgi:hypothetical protein